MLSHDASARGSQCATANTPKPHVTCTQKHNKTVTKTKSSNTQWSLSPPHRQSCTMWSYTISARLQLHPLHQLNQRPTCFRTITNEGSQPAPSSLQRSEPLVYFEQLPIIWYTTPTTVTSLYQRRTGLEETKPKLRSELPNSSVYPTQDNQRI